MGVDVSDVENDVEDDRVLLKVIVTLAVCVTKLLTGADAVTDADAVLVCDPVSVTVEDRLGVPEHDRDADGEGVKLGDGVGLAGATSACVTPGTAHFEAKYAITARAYAVLSSSVKCKYSKK